MSKIYNIGLDIGTNSVGWSVIDDNYELLKFKKRNMWGSRLFDEGQTAEKRRIYRSSRRRLNRRRERVVLLQQLLCEDIEKVDKEFYIRLKESFLYREDRKDSINKSNIFVDKNYKDKDYYKQYRTIYHLRKRLIENDEKEDIRLIYLALHHIIKYRGNFLYEGQKLNDIGDNIIETIQELIDFCSQNNIAEINLSSNNIKDILKNKKNTKSERVEKLVSNKNYKKELKNIFNGILGLKTDLNKIFRDISFEENIVFKFSDDDIEDKLLKVESLLNDKYELISNMQKIYNWVLLEQILNGEKYISFAKVKGYNEFNKQLSIVKKIINNYDRELYNSLFKCKDFNVNYESYIKNKDKAVDKSKGSKSIKVLFYKKIESFIKSKLNDEFMIDEKNKILSLIEQDNFLIIQNVKDNSAVPYQLNQTELSIILDNQAKYYNTIKRNKDKIMQLLNFRIPYYIGPLNNKSEFSWIERKKDLENQKIYPWNMDKIVDIDISAEKFIKKMTNKCSYLLKEDVLPRNSILFSEYMYYNEINTLRINDIKLDRSLKEDLKEKVFLEKAKVKEKDIISWYKNNHNMQNKDVKIEGLHGDKEASTSFKSYKDFKDIFCCINEENINMIEDIIEWITIFTDKKILERKISKAYPEVYSDKNKMKKILNLKYKGWSRLSKKLINGIYYIDSYQKKNTVLDIMKTSNANFMQVINNKKYGFNKKIEKENRIEKTTEITYDNLVSELQGSPKIKRGIWQSIQIVEEIIKIKGYYPQNIFIEFAREDDKSKRPASRKSKIENLYKKLEIIREDYINRDVMKNISKCEALNKRQVLYFLQLGKCMYSGEALEFDSLHLYETDHIIYQSLIKDDSIDNLVLVKKAANQDRSNQIMPANFVSQDIKAWWSYLKDQGLISSKKYHNLMKYSLSRNDEMGFINRQLVETRQIAKYVTNILVNCYGQHNVNVIAIKEKLVSDFKKKYNIYKNRSVNDYHHAKDAFISSIIGLYILNIFPKLENDFIYAQYSKYKDNKNGNLVKGNSFGFIINSMNRVYERDGGVIWDSDKSIGKIKKQLNYKDFFLTKKVCENKGEFYKGTINPKLELKSKSTNPIPIKKNLDVTKYGYYTGENIAYSSIIEYRQGNKRKKKLIGIPIRYSSIIGNSREKLLHYFTEELKLNEVTILKDKILKYQLFSNKKGIFYLISPTEWHNAQQLILDNDTERIICNISNNDENKNNVGEKELIEIYEKIANKIKSKYPIFEKVYDKINSNKSVFMLLNIDDKMKVIEELLKITQANGIKVDLRLLNKKEIISNLTVEQRASLIKCFEREGRLSKKVMNIEETEFIYQSITGMIEDRKTY